MKAVVLTGVRKAEVRDVPKPNIQAPDDVLLKTTIAGLCGSDLHYFITDVVGGERVPYPAIVGHECAAVVETAGTAVTKLKPGDRVAVEPAIFCGTCDQCRADRFNTCRKIRFLGHPGERDGCLAEYFVMPERNCLPLPARLTPAEGMLAEPLSIALHALAIAGEIGPAAAVLGAGPIGLCVILGVLREDVGKIYATDKADARTAAAKRAGASWAGNPDNEDVVGVILGREPLGLDTVFECSGDPAAVGQAVELVKPGGQIVQVGIPVEERIPLNYRKLRRKEIAIKHVRRQNRCYEKALDLVADREIDIAWLATHCFTPEDAQLAFTVAADRLDGVLKASIVFD
jgi:L-iditol 2-dehydrogenase